MPLDIVLLTPRRRFIANRAGLGYQVPLGLVFLGGPLLAAGHRVRLIDNDVRGWSDARLARELAADPPDCVLLGHTGSTAAHPVAMHTAARLRAHFPTLTLVYGGVYPTYAHQAVLRDHPALDAVVRGEGEATVVELAAALDAGRSGGRSPDLSGILGLTWRRGRERDAEIVVNANRPPLRNLDAYPPGWALVRWDDYHLFGFGRAAGMQLSRGCPLRCSYCGQWNFWRQWRHRSPANVVAELETLVNRYGVRIVWFADENFAADREVAREVLELIVARGLRLSLNVNLTAADVVRDADLLPLYKRAGVDNVIMGIEALDDTLVAQVGKDNPVAVSQQAVRLLRANHIVSLTNVIYGLQHESAATLWQTFRRLLTLDSDVLNAVYLTPHFWTPAGRAVTAAEVVQPDPARWTYRNQVIATPHLRPWQLFWGVKLTEALFHLRPRALGRLLAAPDARFRQVLRAYVAVGARVVVAEVLEFLFATRLVRAGALAAVPTYPAKAGKAEEAGKAGDSGEPSDSGGKHSLRLQE